MATTRAGWSGYLATEGRAFFDSPADPRQASDGLSLSFQPEYSTTWDGGRQSFAFVPFLRVDANDEERSHADIRELTWVKAAERWELRLGIRKLFWGVTESQHLVDIINQTDLVESPDGEEKLGQPMANLALIGDWGAIDLFLLPGFRERTFPGVEGRLRGAPPITTRVEYQSAEGRDHVDAALRWSQYAGNWDFALSHFAGTSREPTFRADVDGAGNPVLIPRYELIRQTGLELQGTFDAWLWKLEAISRATPGGRYAALTGGFEYTRYGVFDDADLGLLGEYLWDERGDAATTPFADDLFLGARLTLNDVDSSELLAGVIQDLGGAGRAFSVEASRRFGNHWKLNLEARFFDGDTRDDPLSGLERDDYLQAELAFYF
ncbi:hypothetical protein [Endothiovibrio diazotrophicus]